MGSKFVLCKDQIELTVSLELLVFNWRRLEVPVTVSQVEIAVYIELGICREYRDVSATGTV